LLQAVRERFPAIEFITVPDSSPGDPLPDCDALLAWNISEAELELATNLQWIQWIGAGVENAPLQAMQRRNILFTNNRGVHAINIAEHVMAMMLAFSRALPLLLAAQSKGIWADEEGRKHVRELNGSSLLILGSGNIGLALAERAQAFGQHVTVVGRTSRQLAELNSVVHEIDSLNDYLPLADHVAICLPLTPHTTGLVDDDKLRRMKQGAYLYNIGRGPIVDTDALTQALQDGHLGGAGLDVTDPEPLPAGHPLWTMPNVMLTAHTSGATPRYWQRGQEILIDNIERFLAGRPLRNLVDYDLGY
jgi:phosphoglycerate dehydrogenase-like enzyme